MADKIKLQQKLKKIKEKLHYFNPLYQNNNLYLLVFFLVIPLLFIPITYLDTEIFHIVSFALIGFVSFFIYLKLKNISHIIQGLKNSSISDYRNALTIIENMSNIQIGSAITIGGIILGLFLLGNNLINIDLKISENIRILLVYLMFPTAIIVLFSTIQMLTPPIRKNLDFYLSRAWIMSIESENTESEKMSRLIKCIENYDDFLQKKLKQRINNLEELFANFILNTSLDLNAIIKNIKEKYNSEKFALEEYSVLRYIQEYNEEVAKDYAPLLIKKTKNIRSKISIERSHALIIAVITFVGILLKEILPIILKIPTDVK
jgi:hypothetical protein